MFSIFLNILKCSGGRYSKPDVIVYFGDGRNTMKGSNGNLTALVGSTIDQKYQCLLLSKLNARQTVSLHLKRQNNCEKNVRDALLQDIVESL